MNLDDLFSLLASKQNAIRQHRLPTSQLHVEGDRLIAGQEALRLGNREGLSQLCTKIGAPPKYLRRLPLEVRAYLLSYHLRQGKFESRTVSILSRDNEFLSLDDPNLLI